VRKKIGEENHFVFSSSSFSIVRGIGVRYGKI